MHALQAEKQRKQMATTQAKAIANKANKWYEQAEAVIGEQCRQAAATQKIVLVQAADE